MGLAQDAGGLLTPCSVLSTLFPASFPPFQAFVSFLFQLLPWAMIFHWESSGR